MIKNDNYIYIIIILIKMPRNTKGGNKARKGKNYVAKEKEITFKEEGMEYAIVVKKLGGAHVEVFCFDNETRIAHIRGKMRKRVWLNAGDYILISLREFEERKCDVILKYTDEESKRLIAYGEIKKDIIPKGEFDDCEEEVEIDFQVEF